MESGEWSSVETAGAVFDWGREGHEAREGQECITSNEIEVQRNTLAGAPRSSYCGLPISSPF